MSTRNASTDPETSTDENTNDAEDDTQLTPLQPRHGPQPKRLP